jgi:hypothetical protein
MAVLSCEFSERDGHNEGIRLGDTDCYTYLSRQLWASGEFEFGLSMLWCTSDTSAARVIRAVAVVAYVNISAINGLSEWKIMGQSFGDIVLRLMYKTKSNILLEIYYETEIRTSNLSV